MKDIETESVGEANSRSKALNLELDATSHSAITPEQSVTGDELLVIVPPSGWISINWIEIWRFRELLYFLAWRDIKVRYKQTVMGAAWAVLQPFMTMIVFTIFFGRLGGLDTKTGGAPYPIYVYAGLLPWTFFANTISTASLALVTNANLITKVYFPRMLLPLATAGVALVDLAVSFGVLFVMMGYYHTGVTLHVLLVPALLASTVLVATGVGLILSALTVAYRDFRYVVPFLVQIWMFATPVIYPSSIIPVRFRWALSLNPMAGLIDGFRAAFLNRPIVWSSIYASTAISFVTFIIGASYFRHVERRFSDII